MAREDRWEEERREEIQFIGLFLFEWWRWLPTQEEKGERVKKKNKKGGEGKK